MAIGAARLTFQRWEPRESPHPKTCSKERLIISYQVDDMTCGHCASTITKAVKATDKDAKIRIDLAKHLVTVEPAEASDQEIHDAIAEAGYSPRPVEAMASDEVGTGRSCCGSCH